MKLAPHHRVIERGILTSAYKQEIRFNISEMKRKSLSRIKTSVLNSHDKLQSQTGTALQVSIFEQKKSHFQKKSEIEYF